MIQSMNIWMGLFSLLGKEEQPQNWIFFFSMTQNWIFNFGTSTKIDP